MSILVNELYGPVKQSEGRSTGRDVMFLRLSGCNLACDFCDTPYTWNWLGTKFTHPDKYDKKKETFKVSVDDIKTQLYNKAGQVRGLVISGGEPMLQQERLVPLLEGLLSWWIEVETNGTIAPIERFSTLVNQFNCSPKTSNSGVDNPLRLRFKPKAIMKIAACGDKATFKFVIQSHRDITEVMAIIGDCEIKPSQVWLMPEGRTAEEHEEKAALVRSLCDSYKFNYSPRLHILQFGNKRGV